MIIYIRRLSMRRRSLFIICLILVRIIRLRVPMVLRRLTDSRVLVMFCVFLIRLRVPLFVLFVILLMVYSY